ncbi:hypothetical protein DVH24_018552 [Malus domestica]|uniref:Uncharacterized protein n=1 Tax=Malus domestica TaxID=3750 RepID=A0A498HP67_MALDO|nr:hypothetical protein DVH24_018552 [Malus domestica]
MVNFSMARMGWWWSQLAIGRTGGDCYNVNTVEVEETQSLSQRESSHVEVVAGSKLDDFLHDLLT